MNKFQYGKSLAAQKLTEILETEPKQVVRGVGVFLSDTRRFFNEIEKMKDIKTKKYLFTILMKERKEKAKQIARLESVCSFVQNVINAIYKEKLLHE